MGKPQAIMSEEELEEKETNRTGVSLPKSKSQSRKVASLSSRSYGSQTSGRPSESDVGDVAVEVKRGMILPFQPLSISFDDVSYFVDMPAVGRTSNLLQPTILQQ